MMSPIYDCLAKALPILTIPCKTAEEWIASLTVAESIVEGGTAQAHDGATVEAIAGNIFLILHTFNTPPHVVATWHQFLTEIFNHEGIQNIHIGFTDTSPALSPAQTATKPQTITLSHVKNVILVTSGKGGVGKSTTAFYVALALSRMGQKVGLLDADLYGPSLAVLTGIVDKPAASADKKMIPFHKFGLNLMSMGFLLHKEQPLIWRGPKIQHALHQLLCDVDWGYHEPLDTLIIDTPPGTGDVHLSLMQKYAITGVIMVSTPHDIALVDTLKSYEMCKKLAIPVIGLVENMTALSCAQCGHHNPLFTKGAYEGGASIARNRGIPFLGAIPLLPAIVHGTNQGVPADEGIDAYQSVAEAIVAFV